VKQPSVHFVSVSRVKPVLYPSWCVFVGFQKFEPFRGDKNVPASLDPSSSEAEEMPTTLRFGTLPPSSLSFSLF